MRTRWVQKRNRIFLALSAILFIASLARGQAPGRIVRGTVRDSATGQELSGAIVELVGPSARNVTRSDQRGLFEISRVADGRYRFSVRLIGFAESTRDVDVNGRDLSFTI